MPVYLLHGNRDFLIGKKFARQTNAKILPEETVINLYGQSVLLLHGDVLCSEDKRHMKFRKWTQSIIMRKLFLCLPLAYRRKIGQQLRKTSKQHHSILPSKQLQIAPSAALAHFRKHQVNRMIYGHVHHAQVFNDAPHLERIALGSWDQQGCALKWYAKHKREIVFF